MEVALCGHATLASAHVLWETGKLAGAETARFQMKSGLLTAERRHAEIELNFPATRVKSAKAPGGLVPALGAEPQFVGRSRFDYLLEFKEAAIVRALRPNHALLAKLPVRSVIMTIENLQCEVPIPSRIVEGFASVRQQKQHHHEGTSGAGRT